MTTNTTYGLGGYDPNLPHDNVVETLVDHGDGTGTHTDFTTDPPTVTEVAGLPIPEPDLGSVLSVLASIPPEQLQRVLSLGVLLTEPEAVTTLEAAVTDGDPVQGITVVAEAAAAAAETVQ